jgi:hypothetical protein
VVVATLLPWGTASPFTGAHGAASIIGININNTAPYLGPYIGDFVHGGPLIHDADAWHVAPLSAAAGSLLSASVALTPLRRARAAVGVAILAAIAVALLSLLTWIHPPGFRLGPLQVHRPGPGEPLAIAGAMLLCALVVTLAADRPSKQKDSP